MTSYREMRKVEDMRDTQAVQSIGRTAPALSKSQDRAIQQAPDNGIRQMLAANGGAN